jgi:hypothetical protein
MKRIAAAALAAGLWVPSASATMVISADHGGSIQQYERRYAMVRASGSPVVIDGRCYSACTLVLGLVPPHRVCVTPRARLGFHAAWFPGTGGRQVMSRPHTLRLYEIYPEWVRDWIVRRGGLSSRMLILEGRELRAHIPPCRYAAAPPQAADPDRQNRKLSSKRNGLVAQTVAR